jgi:hypothetical protein
MWVAPGGDDGASGERAAPLRSLAEAVDAREADVVHLLPGVHRGPKLLLSRSVRLQGAPTATVAAHVFVSADGVTLRGLALLEGFASSLARELTLERLRVQAGAKSEAVRLHRSEARLLGLEIAGGAAAALQVTGSTVSARALRVDAGPAQAGVRLDGGQLELERAFVYGGAFAAAHAVGTSTLTVRNGRVGKTAGSGVVAYRGARARVLSTRVLDAERVGLLARGGHLEVHGSTVARSGEAAVSLAGATLRASSSRLAAGRVAALTLGRTPDAASFARLETTTLALRGATGLRVDAGAVELEGVRFVGSPAARTRIEPAPQRLQVDRRGPPAEAAPALVLRGQRAQARLEGVTFERPAGPAVEVAGDAELTARDLEIHEPAGDGIVIDDVAAPRTRLRDVTVRDCRGPAAGVRVARSARISARGLDVAGCSDGALLAVDRASAALLSSRARGGHVGAGAFGGSVLEVEGSTLAGERWSVFAACADGSRIAKGGGNRLEGPAVTCP